MSSDFTRLDGRKQDELREVTLAPGIAPYAAGSVLAGFGKTRIICAASWEKKVPVWMHQQGAEGGWISAEYSLLPYSTIERRKRERAKMDGRTVEIQRLIGRSMRAVADLKKLPAGTLWIDCDVLQADGGTRTAAVTGAYVAARLAAERLMSEGLFTRNPFTDSVAAVSAGVCQGIEMLDLNYEEDKAAAVDSNIVMTGSGEYVEVQSAGEEATFSQAQLGRLLALAKKGIEELTRMQRRVTGAAAPGRET